MGTHFDSTPEVEQDGSKPGHDVFRTPDNSVFLSTNQYIDVNPLQKEIRLLKVLPGAGDDLIVCELQQGRPLADIRGTYTALSYCAGDSQNTGIITVNGVPFTVFANLKHALAECRHFWQKKWKDRTLLLWADQISINQHNLNERAEQVNFMRDIYESAEHVFICLSTQKGDYLGMKWLVSLCKNVPALHDDLLGGADLELSPMAHSLWSDWGIPNGGRSRYHSIRLKSYFRDHVDSETFTNGWIAFHDILECPWWSRAWVFQEFMAASKVYLLHSCQDISWDELAPILVSYFSIQIDFLKDEKEGLRITPVSRQRRRILQRQAQNGCQDAIDSARFMVKSKIDWTGTPDLKALLSHSRYCKASDDRDRVFAFSGLADPGYEIVPNYAPENCAAQVFINTTQRIIIFENSLEILPYAVASEEHLAGYLPSWVVDWRCKEAGAVLDSHVRIKHLVSLQSAYKSINPDISFHELKGSSCTVPLVALEVWGIFLGTLVANSSSWPSISSVATSFAGDVLLSEGSRLVQYFDQRWIISGAKEPMALPSDDYFVASSSSAQHHDELWVLYGAKVPMVLRAGGDGHLVVSSAFVYGKKRFSIDNIIEKVDRGETQRRRISLV